MHHATHKLINQMGGRTLNTHGMHDMHDTHTFFIAKNGPIRKRTGQGV